MWTAKFRDGAVINQFDLQKKEVPFKKILDYDGDLENFTVSFVDTVCSLNLIDGIFTVTRNNTPIRIYTLDSDLYNKPTEFKYRLIYFQRYIEQISTGVTTRSGVLFTAIGFQTNLVDGKNIKRILKIHANNNLIELVSN